MSSDIQFDMYNYTNYTLITQSTGEKHIDDDGAALNDLQLPPITTKETTDFKSATITVSTGPHNGEITVSFLLDDSKDSERIAYVVCTNLKNPEKQGVLKCYTNNGYNASAVGQRNIGGEVRLITIKISQEEKKDKN